MSVWTRADLERALPNAVWQGDIWTASGVEIDTRRIKGGEIFLAFRGEHVDGHDYLADAREKGAVLALVEAFQPDPIPQICVPNMREALWQLARSARMCHPQTQFIAITGSVGKTSTRGLMMAGYSATHRVYASHGNFNNDLGMPLCLAQMGCAAKWDIAVFELGMSAAGELTPLSMLLRPDIALIVNVRAVHQEFFTSLADIARAKAEVFAGLSAGGLAVMPNQKEFASIFQQAVPDGVEYLVYDAPHLQQDLGLDLASAGLQRFRTNILAIVQIYQRRFGDPHAILPALADWQPEAGRGRTQYGVTDTGAEITLIDDSYNASLTSMLACLEDLHRIKGMRKIAVLGDMKELGAHATQMHETLVERLNAYAFDEVYVTGENFYAIQAQIMRKQIACKNAEELVEPLKSSIQTGDVVAFKGSLSVGLAKVIKALNFTPLSKE